MSVWGRLKDSLTKTRQGLVDKIEELTIKRRVVDEEFFDELEEILIRADVGVDTALELVQNLKKEVKERQIKETTALKTLLKEQILALLDHDPIQLNQGGPPTVIVVVGVNGAGKTTTIGKLAHYYKEKGQRVLLAAADTFRAAAIDQLEIWGQKAGVNVIKHQEGSDPAAVAFDALNAARSRRADLVIIDTAGRLHTKKNLMDELKKINRVLGLNLPGAPHEVLLVLDGTSGQNAISQARLFGEATGVTGIVLTKLDGTAKGGVIIGVKKTLAIPVKFIGLGEHLTDLRLFNAAEFVEALFGD
ncbi:MAG: signal recognition particle-docking protein FtsY [Peptococcaceae bacterium]